MQTYRHIRMLRRQRRIFLWFRRCGNIWHTISDFACVDIVEQEHHRGLAGSVICGIDRALAESDRVVVLEDDLEVSPYFLRYMFEALELYQDDPQVMEIHGFTPVDGTVCGETMFLRGADCWGWGTWRRAWHNFEPDSLKLLARFNPPQPP